MRHDHAIVGREDELARLDLLFAADGPAALVIDGEAGIGKTTLWRTGLARARDAGFTVLACQPAQPEQALPFSALADLLEPVLDDELPALPGRQRTALEVALQRTEPTEPHERLAVSRATLSLVRAVATRGHTLVAVDDVQWLDPATADVLRYASRRLADVPVRQLVARRSTDPELEPPLELGRALPGGRLARIWLGPLSLGDLDRLLRQELDVGLPRPRLVELRERSGGNPFYALEIARSLRGGVFRTPSSLAAAVEARLRRLPPAARDAVALVAAAGRPTSTLIEQAAPGALDGLGQAAAEGIVVLDGERVRFTHPLLAGVAYESQPPWERRRTHLRLAAAAEGEERARNLALGTEEPDAAVAAELERAAQAAAARGGMDAAGSLAEHAARLTPAASPMRTSRLVGAAEHHMAAGDLGRGRDLLEELVTSLDPGPERAKVLLVLARASTENEPTIRLCEQALREAAGDSAVLSSAHSALGTYRWVAGQGARCLDHYSEAIRHAERAADPRAAAIAIGWLCFNQVLHGVRWDRAAMDRALELERGIDDFPKWTRPTFQLASIAAYTDDPDLARPLFHAELERLEARGEVGSRWTVLCRLAQSELRCGNWSAALRAAREATELVAQTGFENEVSMTQAVLALVLAHLGDLEPAQELAEQAFAIAEEDRLLLRIARAQGSLGFIALSRGDAEQALTHLTPARERLVAAEVGEFAGFAVVENEIEALVQLARLDEADSVSAHVAAVGIRADRLWHRAVAARGRALVAAARGDEDAARDELSRALAAHEGLQNPFELGRTILYQGVVERRAKHRAAARVALTRALEVFDQLGAPLWSEKAAEELARIPGRAPGAGELSETERRIAELVADGLTNKEVAARLFVTVRTVEGNLTRIYGKLGVRSRTELASRLAREAS